MRERTPIPGELVARLPNLKLLLTTGARNASIDVKALLARGVPVAGTAAEAVRSLPDSTTQHCVALNLGLARNLAQDDAAMKAGLWQTQVNTGLAGKVFGSVGLGRLGAAVSHIMHVAFGMRVVAWSNNLIQEAADEKARMFGLPTEDPATGEKTFRVVSRETLFSESDLVNVHIVLSDRSRGLLNKDDFGRMKKSALFVNTARGPIINSADLLDAAKRGAIRGVALDVYDIEPLPKDSEWRTTRWGEDGRANVLLTPHMGYVEHEPLGRMYELQVENILRWEKGEELLTPYKDTGY
jgi:lactate dehydrogenase-like 2-hydroxyacid dehydrogenase